MSDSKVGGMSGLVDVLAELDRRIELEAIFGDETGTRKLREVRGAVAELIEAAHASLRWDSGDGRAERQRLRAALARAQGGEA